MPIDFQYIDKEGSPVTSSFPACRDLENNKDGHLDSRGWTFQEMYVSARTLRFSAKGMHWTCASQNASEGLPMGQQPYKHKADFDTFIKETASTRTTSTSLATSARYTWWYKAIEKYSKRSFTKESDRHIALSGLESMFKVGLQDEYLSGLWKEDLARGLAWTVDEDVPGSSSTVSAIPNAPPGRGSHNQANQSSTMSDARRRGQRRTVSHRRWSTAHDRDLNWGKITG